MQRYVFAVRERPYCLWGYDLHRENEAFLRSFDPAYFGYLAQLYLDHLEGENTSKAAIGLRAAYHHGLEALFSLLGALAQAPRAVPAWIPKCGNSDLRALVEDISAGTTLLTPLGRQRVTWVALSHTVFANVWRDENPEWATAERFARCWSRFARDYVDQLHTDEYNSIKHGFRISSGGAVLRIGLEPSYGVSPPESEMRTIGASPHGTNFSALAPIPAEDRKSPHIKYHRQRLNWRAEAMIQALQLISWSLSNIVGCLRIANGATPGTVRFDRPEDPAVFEGPWNWPVGVTSGAMNVLVEDADVDQISVEALRHELEARTDTG